MKNWWLCFSFVIHMSALWWGLTALKFSFTWVRRKGSPGPPKYETRFFFSYFWLKLKFLIRLLLYLTCTYMGERIAGKQDRPSLIIEDPLSPPTPIAQNILFFYILAHTWKNGYQMVSPCCTYISTEVWICWHFGSPGTPGFYVRAQHNPENMKKNCLHIFNFNSKDSYQIASIIKM